MFGHKKEIKLGMEVRDKVTGFTGIATMEVEYLYGCNQFGVSPKMNENGEIKDAEFFDEGRLEYVSDGAYSPESIPAWKDGVKLGNEIKDKVTGYSGVMTGRYRAFGGQLKYGIVAKVKEDGTLKSIEWFEVGRIEAVGRGILPEEVQAEKKGGIHRDAPRGIR